MRIERQNTSATQTAQPQPPPAAPSPPAANAPPAESGSAFSSPSADRSALGSAGAPREHVPLPSMDFGAPAAARATATVQVEKGPFLRETVKASVEPKLPIQDNSKVQSVIHLADDLDIEQLSATVDIPHTYRGDLVVSLTSPSGKTAVISNRQGGSADDVRGTFDLSAFKGESSKGDWTLTVEDKARGDVGTLQSWGLDVTGTRRTPPPPEGEPKVITKSAEPNLPVEDNKTVTSTIDVEEGGSISNLKLDLDIAHTYRGDLVVTLTSPSGKTATISNKEGGSADDLRGTFDVSAFKGEDAKGQWKLSVSDTAAQDTGTLKSWGVQITTGDSQPPVSGIKVLGKGQITDRYTAELHGDNRFMYTTSWGSRNGNRGNTINVFDSTGDNPVLKGSITVPGAQTIGDVQVTADGKTLVATSEGSPASITTFDLSDPTKPRLLKQFTSQDLGSDAHTGEVQTINGRTYVFASAPSASPSKLVTVDITDPANPRQVNAIPTGRPLVHDVYLKDGRLYTAGWDDGVTVYDIGGGGKGGTVENPVQLGKFPTKGGAAHNLAVYDDPASGKRYAIVGEEQPGDIGRSSRGDVHVVDITDLSKPKEIAFFNIPGAGTHNFALDAEKGVIYAAYYNGGVVALDLKGDIANAPDSAKASDGRIDLTKAGRLLGRALDDQGQFIWGVHLVGNTLYASDMLNGLWKMDVSGIKSKQPAAQ